MTTRGIRGATVAAQNEVQDILDATAELLEKLQQANPTLDPIDIASGLFYHNRRFERYLSCLRRPTEGLDAGAAALRP